MIGEAKPLIRPRHIHREMVDVRGPHAKRIERQPDTASLPQSQIEGLDQRDRPENFGNTRPEHDSFGKRDPTRHDRQERFGPDNMQVSGEGVDRGEDSPENCADHAWRSPPGDQPASASSKPENWKPGTTMQETRQ